MSTAPKRELEPDVRGDEFELYDDAAEERRLEERRKRRRELLKQLPPPQTAEPKDDGNDAKSVPQRAATPPAQNSPAEAHRPTASDPADNGESEYEEIEVDDDDVDMFALDDAPPPKKIVRVRRDKQPDRPALEKRGAAGLHDNWDDPDGYYRVILGEKLGGGRYQVYANLGRGMFASVVRARDLHRGEMDVAIKIVRRQETMYKAGMQEVGVLETLAKLDENDMMHIVRLYAHFEHKGHLCMVFESLSQNLREIVKRFGKDVGLNLKAVRLYAQQLMLALVLLRRANFMHADIKPDNILVNEAKTVLKLGDLGSASSLTEMEITPYLVSRFYRAPEISEYMLTVLGQAYDCAIDMWSAGCTLYELATGKILFPGKNNNHMLLLMQQMRGKFTSKQLKKCQFAEHHFEDYNTFLSVEEVNGEEIVKRQSLGQPVLDMRARLLPGTTARQMRTDELRQTQALIDLLNRMLELDPARRITPNEALAHPFFQPAHVAPRIVTQ